MSPQFEHAIQKFVTRIEKENKNTTGPRKKYSTALKKSIVSFAAENNLQPRHLAAILHIGPATVENWILRYKSPLFQKIEVRDDDCTEVKNSASKVESAILVNQIALIILTVLLLTEHVFSR